MKAMVSKSAIAKVICVVLMLAPVVGIAGCGFTPAPAPKGESVEQVTEELSWYLSVADGYVAIFKSDSEDPYQITNVAIEDLDSATAAELGAGISVGSLDEAKSMVETYRSAAAPSAEESTPEPSASPAESFPLIWTGTFGGLSSDGSTISTTLQIQLDDVREDGSLHGICLIGYDGTHWYDRTGSYYVEGRINWETGDIEIWGTQWADQGVLEIMRRFEGTVDSDFKEISGTSETTNGTSPSTWRMLAD